MKDTIEWRDTSGVSMGAHKMLMVRNDYVGHIYEDASAGVNVAQVLEGIETRYNTHELLVAALEEIAAMGIHAIAKSPGTPKRIANDALKFLRA